MMDDIQHRLTTNASEAIERATNPPGEVLAALTAVKVTGAQMRAAIEAIQRVPVRSDADPVEHGRILRAFAVERGFPDGTGSALLARAIAMHTWRHRHDPYRRTDVPAFFEAGATCPLIETEEGVAFDPMVFGELVAFIAELPF